MAYVKVCIAGVISYTMAVLTLYLLAGETYFKFFVWALLFFVWSLPVVLVIFSTLILVAWLKKRWDQGSQIQPNENGDYPILRRKMRVNEGGRRVKREVFQNPNLMPASYWFGKELSFNEMRQILLARITSGNFGSVSRNMFDQLNDPQAASPDFLPAPSVPELQSPTESLVIQSVAKQLTD